MKKLLSLLLLIAICLSSFTACSGDDKKSDKGSGTTVSDTDGTGSNESTDAPSTDSPSGDATSSGGETNNELEALRGTTVTFASWEDFNGTERGKVIQNFTKATGIKVNVIPVTQNDYVVKLASRMSAGKAVDIFIDNQEFPRTLSFAQPITNTGIDLNDSKWDKTIIQTSTINGNTYLVNATWDLKYFVLSYNKKLFEGITSPEEYVAAGNWTWDTFKHAAKQITGLGSEYVGAHFSTPIFMAAYGSSYVKYDSSKQQFYRSTDEETFSKVWEYILEGHNSGYFNPTYNTQKLVAGTCGMSINDCSALQAGGYFSAMKESDWGFTYLPKMNQSDSDYPRASLMFAYGLMKGAPNAKGAGAFLNYYLEEGNWNFDNYYANKKAKEFANVLNKRTVPSTDYMFICKGPLAITYTYGYSEIDKVFLNISSANINKGIQQSKNKIENAVNKANDMIKAVK